MPISTRRLEKVEIRQHAVDLRATRILEVGAFKGQTTAVLSDVAAAHGGYVVAIDPMIWSSTPAYFGEWIDGMLHPTSYEKAFWKNVNARGHGNVRLIKALSTDPELLASRDQDLAEFDLVFIDGDHTHEIVMQDIANWGSRVRPGGRLLLHDVARRFAGVVRAMKVLDTDVNVRVTWPIRGMVGTVEILKPIDRSFYLGAMRNGHA
jgi:predicted O-methyltransferase YrrM